MAMALHTLADDLAFHTSALHSVVRRDAVVVCDGPARPFFIGAPLGAVRPGLAFLIDRRRSVVGRLT